MHKRGLFSRQFWRHKFQPAWAISGDLFICPWTHEIMEQGQEGEVTLQEKKSERHTRTRLTLLYKLIVKEVNLSPILATLVPSENSAAKI